MERKMTDILKTKCDLLTDNYASMSKDNSWSSSYIILAAAGEYMAHDAMFDKQRMDSSRSIIKSGAGIFSDFRGMTEYIIRARMSLSDDPQEYFDRMRKIYEILRPGIFGSEFGILASMIILGGVAPLADEETAERTRTIFKAMNQKHRILTAENDMPFAALMAVSGKDIEVLIERSENAFSYLKGRLKVSSDTIQTLANVISVSKRDVVQLCDRIIRIHEILRTSRHSLGRGEASMILASLADNDIDENELAEMVIEAEKYLELSHPFKGFFGLGKEQCRLFASMCVANAVNEGESVGVESVVSASVQISAAISLLMVCLIVASN